MIGTVKSWVHRVISEQRGPRDVSQSERNRPRRGQHRIKTRQGPDDVRGCVDVNHITSNKLSDLARLGLILQMEFTYVHGILNISISQWRTWQLGPGTCHSFRELTESSKLLWFDDICCEILWDRVGSSMWICDWEWVSHSFPTSIGHVTVGHNMPSEHFQLRWATESHRKSRK